MLSQEQPEDVQSLPFTAEEPRPTDTDGGGGSRRLTKSESSALSDPRGPSVVIRVPRRTFTNVAVATGCKGDGKRSIG